MNDSPPGFAWGPRVAIGMNAAEYVLAGGLAVVGPDKPAIVSGDGSVTYGELALRVSRFAAALREAGMNPGDRVAMLMLDHSDLVALYLAIITAGGVAITVSTRATSDDLRHILAIVRPFAVVAESDFAPAVAAGMAPGENCFCASATCSRGCKARRRSLCPVPASRTIRLTG